MISGKRCVFLLMIIWLLQFLSVTKSFSDSITATIEYIYDGVGNITEKKVAYNPPNNASARAEIIGTWSSGMWYYNLADSTWR